MHTDLLEAYRRTEYRVADRGHAFVLRIDERSDALHDCHAAFGVDCSAFITAWNPRSTPTDRVTNDAAMARLEQALAELDCRCLHGEGVDPVGAWPSEPSLLALGLVEADAIALARRFDQYAIVWSGADATPRLVLA